MKLVNDWDYQEWMHTISKTAGKGLVKATLDKPIRFFGMNINEVFMQIIRTKDMDLRIMNENLE